MKPEHTFQRIGIGNTDIAPKPCPGFQYVAQSNYALINTAENWEGITYLYSDGATSCIIIAVIGQNSKRHWLCSLGHLGSTPSIEAFFKHVITPHFIGPVWLYAQGANPPEAESAIDNATVLKSEIERYSKKIINQWSVFSLDLSIGQGDPRLRGRERLGIDLHTFTVSNKPYALSPTDRDPSGGVQSLFSIIGMRINPNDWRNWLWNTAKPFPPTMIAEMVSIAKTLRNDPSDPDTAFINIPNQDGDTILDIWSTTPRYEPSWFSTELVQTAKFVIGY